MTGEIMMKWIRSLQVISKPIFTKSLDDYAVKVEKWKFAFDQSEIKSVTIVPKSTQNFDRYTVFSGATFGR